MSCPLGEEAEVARLRTFVEMCRKQPTLLHMPQLSFFKEYLESLGANIPPPATATNKPPPFTAEDVDDGVDVELESEPDSDLEIDMEGCLEPDVLDSNQVMGDCNAVVSEEDCEKADEKRGAAMSQMAEGNFTKALELFNEAIVLNPTSSVAFVKRGQVFLKLNKPNACIKDCTMALQLNPDSAAAYKFRGRAYRLIGEWENAAQDLRQACIIDMDEQTDEWLREVTPNALKIEQHLLKQERKKSEKEQKQKAERLRKAKEAHEKAAASGNEREGSQPFTSGFPGNAGGPAGMADFYKMLQDPELLAAFRDPEVSAAFQDISTNPGNIIKYQSNPKIMALMTKLSSKFQGSNMNFPGFPNADLFKEQTPTAGNNAPAGDAQNKSTDDFGLD